MHDTSMSKKTVYISRRARFNAAHKLYNPDWSDEKNREVFGKCANANWHGHNYELIVDVTGDVDEVYLKRLANIRNDAAKIGKKKNNQTRKQNLVADLNTDA